MNGNAVALALKALYSTLTEEQQADLRRDLYFNVEKHELDTTDVDAAMELLRGF